MSAVLFALLVIAVAVCLGVFFADVASKWSYKLFKAEVGPEKFILRGIGGSLGLASGLAAVQTGNYVGGLYAPPLAVLWVTVVLLVIIGVCKLLVDIFG